jgi:hypothetical protein
MVTAVLLTTGTCLLGLVLAARSRSRLTCPAVIKEAMFRMWDRHPRSYEASAIIAGWATSLAAVGLLAAGYVGVVKLFG